MRIPRPARRSLMLGGVGSPREEKCWGLRWRRLYDQMMRRMTHYDVEGDRIECWDTNKDSHYNHMPTIWVYRESTFCTPTLSSFSPIDWGTGLEINRLWALALPLLSKIVLLFPFALPTYLLLCLFTRMPCLHLPEAISKKKLVLFLLIPFLPPK